MRSLPSWSETALPALRRDFWRARREWYRRRAGYTDEGLKVGIRRGEDERMTAGMRERRKLHTKAGDLRWRMAERQMSDMKDMFYNRKKQQVYDQQSV